MIRSGFQRGQKPQTSRKKKENSTFQSRTRTPFSKAENCPIQAVCQSCTSVNQSYETSSKLKYEKALKVISEQVSLENSRCVPLELSPVNKGYRTSVKLAIRPSERDSLPEIGLFKPGSHKLVSLRNCFVQDPSINELVTSLSHLLRKSGISAYDEKTHTGLLRYLLVRVSHKRKELSVTFVATSRSCYTDLRNLVKELKMSHNVTSAFLNLNSEKTNRITGTQTKKIFGQDFLKENLCHFDLQVSPLSFFQVNPYTASKIYSRVEQLVGKTSGASTRAWDLYCGVGVFSLGLLRQGYDVVGVEENPSALEDAIGNAKRNFPEGSFSFKTKTVEGFIEEEQSSMFTKRLPEVSIINPSRSGLSEAVTNKLISVKQENKAHRVIYISCEASSLARDLSLLVKGGYTVRQLESFDMFPHTEKLEWVCVLT